MDRSPKQIVFVTGPARSGTTLLYRMLAGGSHYRAFPECSPITAVIRQSQLTKTSLPLTYQAWFGDDAGRLRTFRSMSALLISNVIANEPERNILFLKDPYLIDVHQELSQVFPDAPLLATIRNPIDILRSRARIALNKGDGYDLAADIEEVKIQIRRVRALAMARREDPNFAFVRYETLLENPTEAFTHLAAFLKTEISHDLSELETVKDDPFTTNRSGSKVVVPNDYRAGDPFSENDVALIEEALAFEIRYSKNAETLF